MKQQIKLVIFYFFIIALGTCVYILSFSATQFKSNAPPLIGPFFVLTALCIAFFFIQFILHKINKTPKLYTFRDIIISSLLLFFINFNLYQIIPFNCSRSNSIIIVGYLYKNSSSPKTKNEIEDFVKEEYFIKNRAIEERLEEQTNAGNIKIIDGKYALTQQGIFVVKILGFITAFYNTEKNFAKQ
jgi:hypothetical protein